MRKTILGLVLGFGLFTSCYYDNEEEMYPNTVGTTSSTTPATVTYNGDIKPLIAARCATSGCHVTNATFPDLSDYDKLKANITRVKVRAIDQRTMPAAGPLSNADIAKLQSWIDAGTPNN